MKLKRFSKVLIALCFMALIVGGATINGAFDTNLMAGIDGGVMEDSIHIIPLVF